MHNERIPIREYEKLADTWRPKARCMRQWARLARAAGMECMVMTTKHHDGFCLWDSGQTDYNAAHRGPGRDLVREYVEACREFGLEVDLYCSPMDWHDPDGMWAAKDPAAAGRFRELSYGRVQELCSNCGPIDILWYDNAWPELAYGGWQPARLNAMVRWEGKVKRATLLTTGKPVRVEKVRSRMFLRGLPVANPDRVAHVPVIKLECPTRPRQLMDCSYEDPEGTGS